MAGCTFFVIAPQINDHKNLIVKSAVELLDAVDLRYVNPEVAGSTPALVHFSLFCPKSPLKVLRLCCTFKKNQYTVTVK